MSAESGPAQAATLDAVALAFMREIADAPPIVPDYEVNYCRFCGELWATGSIELALGKLELGQGAHQDDCLWVRANRILRATVPTTRSAPTGSAMYAERAYGVRYVR